MENTNVVIFDIKDYRTPVKKIGDFDLSHNYFILVPLDDEAEEKMYRYQFYDGEEIRSDFLCLKFFEDTFYVMEDYFFRPLNDKFDLFINMYEEDVISAENLDSAIELVQNVLDNTDDSAVVDFGKRLLEMMGKAKELNTAVGFYF